MGNTTPYLKLCEGPGFSPWNVEVREVRTLIGHPTREYWPDWGVGEIEQ